DGAPDEPDSSDWDALCAGNPSPQQLFVALFDRIARGLPDQQPTALDEDDTHRVHTIWFGNRDYGIKVTEIASVETTDFPMLCTWETFGLPGMTVVWRYALEYAGQLGHCAFRQRSLVCEFDGDAEQRRFAEIWQAVIGKVPVFAPDTVSQE